MPATKLQEKARKKWKSDIADIDFVSHYTKGN